MDKDKKTTERLMNIIFRLIRGEKLTTKSLSEEFSFSRRTLQHDLNERLPEEIYSNLIIQNGYYFLDPKVISSFFPEHIQKVLELINAEDVLPHKFTTKSIKQLLSYSKENAPFRVQPACRIVLTNQTKQIYSQLEKAIKNRWVVQFNYRKKQSEKTYQDIEPYRLIDHQGVWYLAAVDSGKLKTFILSNIGKRQINPTYQ